MLMYFLCFLASRDFEIVWFSHEILSFALLCFCFSRRLSSTLGSRGYFFLIDISRRSCVNEAQSAEEKKITSGHRSTQSHFHARISSEIELGHRLDTPMSVVRCSQSGPLLYC